MMAMQRALGEPHKPGASSSQASKPRAHPQPVVVDNQELPWTLLSHWRRGEMKQSETKASASVQFSSVPAHLRMRPVSAGNSRRATWVGPHAERPRFPGPLLRRTRGPDPSSKATLWVNGTLIPSAQRLVWAAKQPLGNAALGALCA